MNILFVIIIITVVLYWWEVIYPRQQLRRFRDAGILQIEGIETHHQNLPLENLGIFYSANLKKRSVQIIFPKLAPEGRIKYIFSWHYFRSISIPIPPRIKSLNQGALKVGEELKFLITEHLQVDDEIEELTEQWHELYNLRELVATSDLYSNQLSLYERGLTQIEQLKNKAEQLEQIYIHAIREILIGREIAEYNLDISPERVASLESQYQDVKVEYQMLKDATKVYTELLNKQ